MYYNLRLLNTLLTKNFIITSIVSVEDIDTVSFLPFGSLKQSLITDSLSIRKIYFLLI